MEYTQHPKKGILTIIRWSWWACNNNV